VSIGIALDSTYSYLAGFLSETDWHRIIDLLLALRLPVYAPELAAHVEDPEHPRSVLRGLSEFREHLGGRLTVILLEAIGQGVDVHDIRPEVIIRSIGVLRQIDAAGSGRLLPAGAPPGATRGHA
jgi:3-dehydroquinate synthase